ACSRVCRARVSRSTPRLTSSPPPRAYEVPALRFDRGTADSDEAGSPPLEETTTAPPPAITSAAAPSTAGVGMRLVRRLGARRAPGFECLGPAARFALPAERFPPTRSVLSGTSEVSARRFGVGRDTHYLRTRVGNSATISN